ncbi:hypothetical protein D3C84_1202980 [compost metagenome]
MNQVVDNILKFAKRPELIDRTSLMYVLEHSKAASVNMPAYQSELETAFIKESEKYLLGAQNLDSTLKAAKEKIQSIIDAN